MARIKSRTTRKIRYVKDELKQARQTSKVKRLKIWSVVLLVLFLVLMGFFIYGMNHENLQIKEIEIIGNSVVKTDDIRQVTESVLEDNLFFVIRGTNIFLYNRGQIKNDLTKKYGYIADVDLNRRGFDQLEIKITEREARYIWCEELRKNCYLADKEGFLFSESTSLSNNVLFTLVAADKERDFNIFTKPLASNDFLKTIQFITNIEDLLDQLSEGKMSTNLAIIEEYDDITIMVNDYTGGDMYEWEMRLNTEDDLRKVVSNMETILSSESFKEEKRLTKLAYVDFRFGNKIFYKHLNSTLVESEIDIPEDDLTLEEVGASSTITNIDNE